MRSAGGQVVVVVLMILQAAAISGRRPIPPPETTCTTDETTTVTPSPTTTTTTTTTPIPTTTTTPTPTTTTTPIPTTTECPIADCFLIECRTVTGEDGCLTCDCSPYNCDNVTCDPGQECVMRLGECNYPTCLSEPSCVTQTSETTMETTTETTTRIITCPPVPQFSDYDAGCGRFLDSDGCYRYRCYTCDEIQCGEGTTCELQICYDFPCQTPAMCVSTTETTTETITETTTETPPPTRTPTPTPSCPPPPPIPHYPGCGAYEGEDGCIRAECHTCDEISCPEGTTCELQTCYTYPCPPPVICVSSTGTTTETTTETITETTTTSCPPLPPYARIPGCGAYEDPDGCIRVRCYTCDDIPPCDEGTTCELQTCWGFPCPPPVICVSTTGTTTETTTETIAETTTTSCPPVPPYARLPGCGAFPDSDGCMRVRCYTCDDIPPCDEGTTCELQVCRESSCPPPVICVPTTGTTTETTTETITESTTETTMGPITPACEDLSWCTGGCSPYYDGSGGCPTCLCVDPPICGWRVQCGADEECLESPDSENGYACFSIYGTTTEPTTETTTETTTSACEDLSSCTGTCSPYYDGSGGCPTCLCGDPICGWLVQCGPDEECLPSPESEYGFACFSIYADTTTEITTPVCEDMSSCTGGCSPYYDGSGGCPTCLCVDPICGFAVICGPDEECLESPGSEYGFACFSIYGTTTEMTTLACEDMSGCAGSCKPSFEFSTDGCPTCVCDDEICGPILTCGPGEECLPSPGSEYGYACFGTTTETTTETTTWTTTPTTSTDCPIVTCGPNCARNNTPGPDGCDSCECYPNCWDTPCDPGYECVFQFQCPPCFPLASCVPINGTTTETTTETTTGTTTPVCEDMWWCTGSCKPTFEFSTDGCPTCLCIDEICGTILTCGPDEECLPSPGSEYGYACFSATTTVTPTVTLTDSTPTTPTKHICPMVFCKIHCTTIDGPDGCAKCVCPNYTCQNLTCRTGEECVMQEVECPPDTTPCFAQPACVPSYETTTPCPLIKCARGCVSDTGSDGCPFCACPPSCDTVKCSAGHECQLVKVDCIRYPCFPQAQCVSVQDTTSVTPTPTDSTPITPTKHICPMPLCLRECPPVEGPDGCLECVCPDYNCQNVTCPPGEECVMVDDCPSDHPPCPFQPICVRATTTPCPQIKCARECVSDTGSDGCSFCACPPSCNTVKCSAGHECRLVNVTCIRDPCFPQPQCVPVQDTTTQGCRMYKCAPNCVPDTGSDGCPICACPPTCETVRCSAGHECQLFNVTCKRAPCFPQPQCVPVEDPCTGTPNPGRCGRGSKTRWTYNSLTGRCESFRYYGCTPSPNTFRSRKECRNKCSGNSQIICPAFVCEDDCYTFVRRNECQRCICPNPCKGFRCRKGYECKMRETKCDKEPKPFCAKKPCPPQDP